MIENFIGIRRARQLHRLFRHCKVTFLCLLLTIIVLRGTIGAGKFGTPEQDFLEIRNRFTSRKFPHRLLDENNQLVLSSMLSISSQNVVDSNRTRVLLVTGSSSKNCENSLGDYYLLKSIKNKIDYCRLHGIEIFYDMALLEAEMSGFREKLLLIRSILLGHLEVEFVWWMDSDVMFTDMAFEVPWERYKGYNLVVHGSKEVLFEEKNWVGFNSGSFLVRNCQWSLDFIESWSKMGSSGKVRIEGGESLMKELKGGSSFERGDELGMVYLLGKEKERWGGEVYLENEYYLHGFWEVLVEKYEKMVEDYRSGVGERRWPLVTHVVGCKPCAKMGDYSKESCLKQMEKAFNFGDNQVLGADGFTHNSLSSARIKKLQNERLNQQKVNGETLTKPAKVSPS